jgi:hypothetical protein
VKDERMTHQSKCGDKIELEHVFYVAVVCCVVVKMVLVAAIF